MTSFILSMALALGGAAACDGESCCQPPAAAEAIPPGFLAPQHAACKEKCRVKEKGRCGVRAKEKCRGRHCGRRGR